MRLELVEIIVESKQSNDELLDLDSGQTVREGTW